MKALAALRDGFLRIDARSLGLFRLAMGLVLARVPVRRHVRVVPVDGAPIENGTVVQGQGHSYAGSPLYVGSLSQGFRVNNMHLSMNGDDTEAVYGYWTNNATVTNSTITIGCNNIFGQDPPKMFGIFFGNANNYPAFEYDNIGRFWYVELKKKGRR